MSSTILVKFFKAAGTLLGSAINAIAYKEKALLGLSTLQYCAAIISIANSFF